MNISVIDKIKNINKKLKIIILAIIIILGLIFGGFYFLTTKTFQEWMTERNIEKSQKNLAEFLSQDTYGGKTPYETFDMFLAAMEKGEVELALKYFNRPDKYIDEFLEMKENGTLTTQVEEWKKARETFEEVRDDYNDWENRATIQYKFILENRVSGTDKFGFTETLEPGTYKSEIILDFNKYSKVWKITLL